MGMVLPGRGVAGGELPRPEGDEVTHGRFGGVGGVRLVRGATEVAAPAAARWVALGRWETSALWSTRVGRRKGEDYWRLGGKVGIEL